MGTIFLILPSSSGGIRIHFTLMHDYSNVQSCLMQNVGLGGLQAVQSRNLDFTISYVFLCDNITSVASRCRAVMQNNTAKTLIKHMAQTKVPLLLLKDIKVTWFKHGASAQQRLHKAEAALTKKTEKIQEKKNHLHVEARDCSHLFTVFFLNPLCYSIPPPLQPPSAENHYRNTISNTSAQVFDRLQTNLYSGGKQKAAEIYLLSVEERNKLAREPWVTS